MIIIVPIHEDILSTREVRSSIGPVSTLVVDGYDKYHCEKVRRKEYPIDVGITPEISADLDFTITGLA